MNKQSGFTLVELLISIGILVILAMGVLLWLNDYRKSIELDADSRSIASIIHKAQAYSMSGKDGKNWGVHFENDKVILFRDEGGGFSTATYMEEYLLSSSSNIASVSLNGGGNEILFNANNGSTVQYGVAGDDNTALRIEDLSNPGNFKKIIVSPSGVAEIARVQSETSPPPTSVPSQITSLAAISGNDQITLNWTAPSDNGSLITDYKIYRSTVSGAETYLANVGSAAISYIDFGLINGTTYYYKVSAMNANGEGILSNEINSIPDIIPESVNNLAANRIAFASDSIRAEDTSTYNIGSNSPIQVSSINVPESTSGAYRFNITLSCYYDNGAFCNIYEFSALAQIKKNGSVIIPSSVLQTKSYTPVVISQDYLGSISSTDSITLEIWHNGDPYYDPKGAVISNFSMGYDKTLQLSWTAPAPNGGSEIIHYHAYRSTSSDFVLSPSNLIGDNISDISYINIGLDPDTIYYFKVSAVNAAGEGIPSNEISASIQATSVPAQVTGVTTSSDDVQINLFWTAPSDNGSPITDYNIYRSTVSGAETYLTNVGSAATLYIDTDIIEGTTYYYKVSAINANGEGEQSFEISGILPDSCLGITNFTDIDGNIYNTIAIGMQCWAKENLKVTRDPQGNSITRYCYNDDPNNCNIYGGLYDWDTIMNGSFIDGNQGVCPVGWGIPRDIDWYWMENYLKEDGQSCLLNRNGAWDCDNTGTKISIGGSSDFEALFSGYRTWDNAYISREITASFWSSAQNGINAWQRSLSVSKSTIYRGDADKRSGRSIRCISTLLSF